MGGLTVVMGESWRVRFFLPFQTSISPPLHDMRVSVLKRFALNSDFRCQLHRFISQIRQKCGKEPQGKL
jgi:hypothetical protein